MIPACSRIRLKYSHPRFSSFVALIVFDRSSWRFAYGSAVAKRGRSDGDAVHGERCADAFPVGEDQHAAGVEEDSFEGHAANRRLP